MQTVRHAERADVLPMQQIGRTKDPAGWLDFSALAVAVRAKIEIEHAVIVPKHKIVTAV